MNQLDKIYERNQSEFLGFAREYGQYLSQLIEQLPYQELDRFVEILFNARDKGHTVYFIGNGGSAATASHFSNDFGIGPRLTENHFKAVSLTDNMAVITAIGNDFGYEYIFSKQLEVVMKPGDVLVAISASGNSPNIIKACEYAKLMGNTVVGLTGFDGGELMKISDIKVHVGGEKGEYGPVEDLHMVIDHLVGSYINRKVKS